MKQTCVHCVMDTTDPDIVFDAKGVCNHCHLYGQLVKSRVPAPTEGQARLQKLVSEIQTAGRGKDYDCVIGVSGGVDSTFVAYKVKELGLRPLAVHLDNGWDSELAVNNIEAVLKKLAIELYTHVIDWEEFRDLQLAFLRASTPDAEIPSDHAIVALMYQMARKVGVRYILSGCNIRTETHLPRAWSHGHQDWKYIRAIHARYGQRKLTSYPYRTFLRLALDRVQLRWVDILNYLDYSKPEAINILERKLGWQYYGGKHYESIYTRFYQGYYLPRKFGYDKRKTHLSSLICSGQISREAALADLKNEPYPPDLQAQDREYVIKKFQLTEAEFQRIMDAPPRRFDEFPSYERSLVPRLLLSLYKALRRH